MTLIKWDDSYSVGVTEMDNQHKKLIILINQLYSAIKEEKGREIMNNILFGLVDYTKVHFSSEEEYMKKFNYPGLSAQISMHNIFLKKLDEYIKLSETENVSIDVLIYLRDWLINHIQKVDISYTETFNKNGLE